MKVGVPKETKNNEYRVAITPAGVHELSRGGHQVIIEAGAGEGSSIPDEDFTAAGAKILPDADDVWAEGELILKVKEPVAEEYHRMRSGQVLFTYLHLAASKACTDALLGAGVTAIAYETVQLPDGSLPLLAPMSEVAGRMAPQVGAHHLQRDGGGRGVLMGGVSGVYAAKVVVLGAGVSGMNAAAIALGMQAEVLLVDKNIARLRQADAIYQGHLQTVASNAYEIERAVIDADLVIGAVLVPGAKAPKLVSDELVARMKTGAVLVDIAIDQGGCFEGSHPTTHANPTYKVHDALFYCVANMPGAVPHTSTHALTNVTLPYTVEIANRGWRDALRADRALALGLNTYAGQVTCEPVAEAHALPYTPLADVLACAGQVAGAAGMLADTIRGYLQHLVVERGLAPNTVQAYQRDLRRYESVLAQRGKARLGDVTPADVAEFLASLREGDDEHAGLAVSSAARAVIAVRGLHAFAVAQGLADADPARDVPPPAPPRRLPKAITVAEVERLLDASGPGPDDPSADPRLLRDRALLEFLYGTGARISEATGLDVDELRLDADPVVRLAGKGGKQRVVPVGSYAVRAVAAYLVRAGPRWPPDPGGPR